MKYHDSAEICIRMTEILCFSTDIISMIESATSLQRGLIRPRWREVAVPVFDLHRSLRLQFLVLLMMGAVTPETCSVTLQ